LCRRKWS